MRDYTIGVSDRYVQANKAIKAIFKAEELYFFD